MNTEEKKTLHALLFVGAVIIVLMLLAFTSQGCLMPAPTPSPSAQASVKPETWPITGWLPEYEEVVKQHLPPMAYGMTNLCPRWWSVDREVVWVKLWKGIISCESSFNRTNRYVEPGMGTDPVTGKRVASEGLLQLSYQDVPNYRPSACDAIDWQKDKGLNESDPRKTIFDPLLNLRCGMAIAERLMAKNPSGGRWGTGLGLYWSCSRPGSRGIAEFHKLAPECL